MPLAGTLREESLERITQSPFYVPDISLIVSVRRSETTGNLLIVNHPFISESVLQAEVAVVRKCQQGGGIFSVEGWEAVSQ